MAHEPASKRRRLSPPGEAAPGFLRFDLEKDYQERLRKKVNKKDDRRQKLPIKTSEGWSEQYVEDEPNAHEQMQGDSNGEDKESADVHIAVADAEVKPKPTVSKLSQKEQIIQAKEDLARIAGNVSESPEDNIGMLAALAQVGHTENVTVKKLVLATQLAVYKDIIPGYRIRPLSKADLVAKVSKDVKRLRAFEQGLLSGYREYVQTLNKLLKRSGSRDAKVDGLATVATTCVVTLLTHVPHFNMRNELIGILVQKLSTRQVDGDFTKCREGLEQLFRDDEDGHGSLEAVNQLTRMMKSKNYHVHETVLNVFLHLRLLGELNIKASTTAIDKPSSQQDEWQRNNSKTKKKEREFRTKRERKLMRERKQVEKEMKDADAVVSYEERDKNQSETLKLVFVAYFRILKARIPGLMGAVLEGLARYSHLINQEFFGDILEALKDLINESEQEINDLDDGEAEQDVEESEENATERNISRESLLCIITAFALLQGQVDVAKSASTLNLDLDFFITTLYRTLLSLSQNPDIEYSASKIQHLADPNGLATPNSTADIRVNVATTSALLIRSLTSTLLPPTNTRSVPSMRVAAFVKQLMTMALHLPHKSTQAVLALVKAVTKVHGSKIAALWCTEERKGDGVFDQLSGEVEGSNPFACTIWEGELLRLHWDPKVREGVKGIEGNVKQARV